MKNSIFLFRCTCALSVSVLVLIFAGCSYDKEVVKLNNQLSYEHIYRDLKSKSSTKSLFKSVSTRSDIMNSGIYPTITDDDIRFLLSLSQDQFEDVLDGFIRSLRDAGITDIEEDSDSKFEEVFEFLGGREGIDQLLNFAESYLNSDEGWENVEMYLPADLPAEHAQIYIGMALYIDDMARPIFKALTEVHFEDTPYSIVSEKYKDDNMYCIWELRQKLIIASVGLTAGAFLDIMSEGLDTYALYDLTAATAMELWMEYEVCNNRWH